MASSPESLDRVAVPKAHDASTNRVRLAGLGLGALSCLAVGAALGWFVIPRPHSGAIEATPLTVGDTLPLNSPVSTYDPRVAAVDRTQPFPLDAPVLLVGDSLAVGIAGMVQLDLPRRVFTVDAVEGRSTPTTAAALSSYASGSPPIWIVSLGTNDSPDVFSRAAESVMSLAGPRRCVVWFNVHRTATQESINAELNTLTDSHPNLHVIDWESIAANHPEWFSTDGIHPSESGYKQRALLATNAVRRWCA